MSSQRYWGWRMGGGGDEWGKLYGVWRWGDGVIAMIYGVSGRWGSANGRVGGIAFGDSQIDFWTPNLIPYKPMHTS